MTSWLDTGFYSKRTESFHFWTGRRRAPGKFFFLSLLLLLFVFEMQTPPGMHLGAHGFAFDSQPVRDARRRYESDKRAFLTELLGASAWTPAEIRVLCDPDDESVDKEIRCWELGPVRALPFRWIYSLATGKLVNLAWTRYDAWRFTEGYVALERPKDESIVEDMFSWFNDARPGKPF